MKVGGGTLHSVQLHFRSRVFFVLRDRQLHFTEQYVGPSHYLKGSKVKVNKSLVIFTMKVVQSQLQIKI